MRIYVSGKIAYETARRLYDDDRETFENRFPGFFLREFEKLSEDQAFPPSFLGNLCIEKNTKKLYSRKNYFLVNGFYVREIGEGGIFAALWAACEDLAGIRTEQGLSATVGCRVNLEHIPVDQHTVEILELMKENPYEADSKGSWLIIGPATVTTPEMTEIGTLTSSKERVVLIGDRKRYLSPPVRQEKDIANRREGNQKPRDVKSTEDRG